MFLDGVKIENISGFRLQVSGFRRRASGIRRRATGYRRPVEDWLAYFLTLCPSVTTLRTLCNYFFTTE